MKFNERFKYLRKSKNLTQKQMAEIRRDSIMPNSPRKNPQYALRVPAERMNKLKYIAEYNGRSANKEIERLILARIHQFEKEHGVISLEDFVPRSRH